MRSARAFSLPEDLDPDYAKTVSLDELTVFVPNQRVVVNVKVLEVDAVEEVTKKGSWRSLDKQEVLVADHSEVIRVVLWEKDVNRMEKGKSYCLHSVNTRTYQDRVYLSVSDCTSIKEIADIGEVAEPDCEEERSRSTAVGENFIGNIVSVTSVDVYKSCMACSGKVVINSSGDLACCTKCNAMQRAATGCVDAMVARVMLQSIEGNERRKVTIFHNILSKIIVDLKQLQKHDELPQILMLLSLPEMCFGIKSDVVYSARANELK